MPAAKMIGGKTRTTLYKREVKTFREVIDLLTFVERNSEEESAAESDAATARQAIGDILERLCAETPEQKKAG